MDNSTQIQQLIKNRKLSSEEEFKLFEDALHKLQGNITIDDVYEICNAFCDDCEDDEVMFGIIHLIEQLEMDGYLKCIALCSPDMVGAHEWAMTLNKRIINNQLYFEKYIDVIDKLEKPYKEKILKLLLDVKNDNPKRFTEKVDLIYKRTGSVK